MEFGEFKWFVQDHTVSKRQRGPKTKSLNFSFILSFIPLMNAYRVSTYKMSKALQASLLLLLLFNDEYQLHFMTEMKS